MSTDNYQIKIASREELDIAVNWAAQEGWNPGLYDAKCFYQADPQGFLIAYLDQQPIASISVVKYGQSFAFLGFYIVKPEYRGQGYGLQIWQAGLKHLQGRNIGLDGVVEQQKNYQKSGFTLAYRNIRYAGKSTGLHQPNSNIIKLNELAYSQIATYDSAFFPDNRDKFLQIWLAQPQSIALGSLSNNQLNGYGLIRICRNGYKIGPLFADTSTDAENLLQALIASVPAGENVFLDIPEVNSKAIALVKKHAMEKVFETARMYSQNIPDIDTNRLYGVTSFELG